MHFKHIFNIWGCKLNICSFNFHGIIIEINRSRLSYIATVDNLQQNNDFFCRERREDLLGCRWGVWVWGQTRLLCLTINYRENIVQFGKSRHARINIHDCSTQTSIL